MKYIATLILMIFIGYGAVAQKKKNIKRKGKVEVKKKNDEADKRIMLCVNYLKNKRVIDNYTVKDTLFVFVTDTTLKTGNFYLINDRLRTTKRSVCDSTRLKRGYLELKFSTCNSGRTDFVFANGVVYRGYLDVNCNNAIRDMRYFKRDE